jgi:hypothetical protein
LIWAIFTVDQPQDLPKVEDPSIFSPLAVPPASTLPFTFVSQPTSEESSPPSNGQQSASQAEASGSSNWEKILSQDVQSLRTTLFKGLGIETEKHDSPGILSTIKEKLGIGKPEPPKPESPLAQPIASAELSRTMLILPVF